MVFMPFLDNAKIFLNNAGVSENTLGLFAITLGVFVMEVIWKRKFSLPCPHDYHLTT